MSGVLFIVVVPRKEYEECLKGKKTKSSVDKNNSDHSDVDKERAKNGSSLYSNTEMQGKLRKSDVRLNTGQDQPNSLYKSKSESILLHFEESVPTFRKYSWGDLKNIIKQRKNKVKISRPLRIEDILTAFHSDTTLEIIMVWNPSCASPTRTWPVFILMQILLEILKRLEISNATWSSTREGEFWQVTFTLESTDVCEETLQVLRTFGIGTKHNSTVSVIPCALFFKDNSKEQLTSLGNPMRQFSNETAWTRFASSVRSRTNLEQILHDVRNDAALTFDWLFLLIVAAFVAAIGLVENSTIILVASMLISPLMGPITAGTLGTAVRDHKLQTMGVTNELLGLFLSLVIGFIFGLLICIVDFNEKPGVGDWPTYEMMSRCEIRSLWVGVLIAIPSGAGVALAVLGEYTASLVGVAISASLLPPAVNAGLLWSLALVQLSFQESGAWSVPTDNTYSNNPAVELAILGTISLCLTLVNIICIFLAGVAVYKVKEVSSLGKRDITWWRTKQNSIENSKWDPASSYANVGQRKTSLWSEKAEGTLKEKSTNLDAIRKDNIFRQHEEYYRSSLVSKTDLSNSEIFLEERSTYTGTLSAFNDQSPISFEEQGRIQINDTKELDILENNDKNPKENNFDYLNSKRRYGFLSDTDDELYHEETSGAVIEPSLCYTVDKNCNPILADNSFAV